MLFQGAALFDSLTVAENVAFPLREHTDMDEAAIAARVREVLAEVDLAGIEARLPAELSGGMRKRAGLARALALAPQALLYDEPTTGLDPVVAAKINALVRHLQSHLGLTSVVVTHTSTAPFVADRLCLADGAIRAIGTPRRCAPAGMHACAIPHSSLTIMDSVRHQALRVGMLAAVCLASRRPLRRRGAHLFQRRVPYPAIPSHQWLAGRLAVSLTGVVIGVRRWRSARRRRPVHRRPPARRRRRRAAYPGKPVTAHPGPRRQRIEPRLARLSRRRPARPSPHST
jgi:ABC-type sulfate/molybdate transport systems ATPase subunit